MAADPATDIARAAPPAALPPPASAAPPAAAGAAVEPTRAAPTVGDIALALVLGAAALSLYIGADAALFGDVADYPRAAGIASVALIVLPLALARRFPLGVLVVTTLAYIPYVLLAIPEYAIAPVAFFIALYAAGAYGGRGRNVVRGLVMLPIAGLVIWALADSSDGYPGRVPLEPVNTLTAFQNIFYVGSACYLGEVVRTRGEREAVVRAQADELRAAQAERDRRAVLDERVRIDRELHDVVAHHVSLMGVQAGAARRLLDRRPEAVPDLLASIEGSSRQAVAEMHNVLGLLRADGTAGPQPTLAQLTRVWADCDHFVISFRCRTQHMP